MDRAIAGEIALLFIGQAQVHGHLAFNSLQDIEHGDILRLSGKGKAAFDASIRPDDLRLYQFLEYLGEKTAGDLVLFRDLGDKTYLFIGLPRKVENTADAVIAFPCQLHDSTIANQAILSSEYTGRQLSDKRPAGEMTAAAILCYTDAHSVQGGNHASFHYLRLYDLTARYADRLSR